MHTLSVSCFLSLLVSLALASQDLSQLSSKLVRRHDHDHASFSNIHIMKQQSDHPQGYLQIYNPDGSVAFLFKKETSDTVEGASSTVVMNNVSHITMKLNSVDDVCMHKSHYMEVDSNESSHSRFEIDPRGPKADRWKFSYLAPSGAEFRYMFKRNFWNKGGNIYRLREGGEDTLIANLEEQVRWEPWLYPKSKGVSTFTLRSTADAPLIELITLMGLVFTRVHKCRL
ncbi:hypothetical protein PCANC_16554 [Puccinia coronata f. sp. avenae]|uniref:Glycoside hydrolase 131 catalytic N-terminal domain-containing protein n=1 Tax=Puccinia coronata f. sp. avenae TaxID=200324 RepID=A0A2N5SH06_9BASI|nr:hypothetical protein PCANC_16554 [Puccinia coronata f. sp. avenae]